MNEIILKIKIPCNNCAISIQNTLKNVKGVVNVECSVERSEVLIKTDRDNAAGNDELRNELIDLMKRTGRIIQ